MKNLRFLFALLALLLVSGARAATNDSISINGQVIDAFTHEVLDSVRIDVQTKGGISTFYNVFFTHDFMTEVREMYGMDIYTCPPEIGYQFKLPTSGSYIFTLSRRGYATQEVEIKVPARQYGRKTREWEAKDILLLRSRERALNEAVVTATKVMMVHRGDTVVFNADYFELSQGSMLDELISRMPGLEIKEGGQIFYNGNRLSSLLVNGKDFFSGDPAIALQNLPAYTVKEVKVFHTASAEERFAKHKDEEHKAPNTLDVVLKREFCHGWIANATIGTSPFPSKGMTSPFPSKGGESLSHYCLLTNYYSPLLWRGRGRSFLRRGRGRFLARLFALHYGNHSRLGLFGNFNNVNDANAANTNGNWSGSFTGQGVAQTAWGGLLYSINSKDKSTCYDLDLQAKHTTNDVDRFTSTTSFFAGQSVTLRDAERLPSTSTYRRSTSTSEQDAMHLAINNKLEWKGKDAELKLRANAAYDNERGDYHLRSAQFSAAPEDAYRGASLDSLFVGPSSAHLAQILTNRLEQSSMLRRNAWEQITSAELSFREPVLGNNGSLKIGSEYKGRSDQKYEHYDLRTRPQPLPEGRGEVSSAFHCPSTYLVSTPLPSGEGQGVGLSGVGLMGLNRYTTTPFSDYHFSADFNYKLNNMLSEATAKWLWLGIGYNADVKHQSGDRQLYNLHNLAESFSPSSEGTGDGGLFSPPSEGLGEVLPLGTLPSMANWKALALSAPDSYESHGLKVNHTLAPRIILGNGTKMHGALSLTPRMQFIRNRYERTTPLAPRARLEETLAPARTGGMVTSAIESADDADVSASPRSGGTRGVADRAYSFFTPSARWSRSIMTESEGMLDQLHIFAVNYNLNHTAPEASLLLDIRDAADPLSINLGNSALKPSSTHNLSAEWLYTRDSRECQFDIEANYSRTRDAVAMGYSYNNITGVYTHQPQNVDGNWQTSFDMRFSRPLDKKRLLRLNAELRGNYGNSVDLVNAQLSEVYNQSLTLHTSLSYKLCKKVSIELSATPSFQHATSDRPGFTERNTWDLSYGPWLSYRPMRDLSLSTSLRIHSRRGYDDASMNDDELVWNANVTYAFGFRRHDPSGGNDYYTSESSANTAVSSSPRSGGKRGVSRPWSIRLEGFDLLHQLSNTRRVLNAQGITETWTNSLPSYVMLHLTYRWSKQPKKK